MFMRSCEHHENWDKLLPYIVNCYNNTHNSAINATPNSIYFGRPVGTLQSALMVIPEEIEKRITQGEFLAKNFQRMQLAYSEVQNHLKKAATYNDQHYNRFLKPVELKPGQRILIFSARKNSKKVEKFRRPFSTPGVVLKKITSVLYSVKIRNRKNPCLVSLDKIRVVEDDVDISI